MNEDLGKTKDYLMDLINNVVDLEKCSSEELKTRLSSLTNEQLITLVNILINNVNDIYKIMIKQQ